MVSQGCTALLGLGRKALTSQIQRHGLGESQIQRRSVLEGEVQLQEPRGRVLRVARVLKPEEEDEDEIQGNR